MFPIDATTADLVTHLRKILPEVMANNIWCAETSADPANWTPENPAYGQCAVTALLVQDLCGGEIVWAEAVLPDGSKVSHYFNRLDGGEELDVTRGQFPEGTIVPEGKPRKPGQDTRAYVLAYPVTVARYKLLCDRAGQPANL
ncbi:MAG: hypothetical protein GC134_03780 [Proteobacteria bacterium]|nr:hypothetical protein [Pseudomonadota bacterium]